MRAGALSDKEVGAYLKDHYVAAWERVGTFTVVQHEGKAIVRAGGNVALYFCTPELEVVHAVAGPVGKEKFLAEAKWAAETYRQALAKAGPDREALVRSVREAHEAQLGSRREVPGRRGDRFEQSAKALLKALAANLDKSAKGDKAAPAWRELVESLVEDESVLDAIDVATGGGRSMHRLLAKQGLPKLNDVYRHVFEQVLGERVTQEPVRTLDRSGRRPAPKK